MTAEKIILLGAMAALVFGYYRQPAVFAGIAMQVAYLFLRGFALGRIPLVGPHDTLVFFSMSVMIFSVPVASRLAQPGRLTGPSALLAVFLMGLSLFYPPHNTPLTPVLRTFWFETHVAFSFFSYALFGIAAVVGGIAVLERKGISGQSATAGEAFERAEAVQYKTIFVGYVFFSAAMIFGGIWAFYAWGTYWLWTPKELWTVILWLFYSLYLHARLRAWWSGTPSAVLGIAGFAIVMITYLGVSLFMKSSHTF